MGENDRYLLGGGSGAAAVLKVCDESVSAGGV